MFKQKNLAVFGLLFGAITWGVIWYPYRLLSEAGVSGVVSSFYTYCIAVLLAGLVFAKQWRGLFAQPKSIILLSIFAGWTNLSYVLAVIDGEVMRVLLLFYLSPLWTLLLAHFWLKEQITPSGMLAIAVSLIGAFIMLWQPNALPLPTNTAAWMANRDHHLPFFDALPLPKSAAEWLALSAGISFSIANVMTRKASHLSVTAKSFAVWLGVIGVSLLAVLWLKVSLPNPSQLSAVSWLTILGIAIFLVLATLFVQYGVSNILANHAAVLFLFELVVAAIASYYLAGERMTANEWLGGALIVAASIYAAYQE